jgi:hypothetical protein
VEEPEHEHTGKRFDKATAISARFEAAKLSKAADQGALEQEQGTPTREAPHPVRNRI